MIVTTAQLFKVAYGKFAVGAYNINNAEQAMGLFKGASAAKAAVHHPAFQGARAYTDKRMIAGHCPRRVGHFPGVHLCGAPRPR